MESAPSVEELLAAYEIDQGLVNPRPRWIGVFDDVLTAGTHFVAMKSILQHSFPGVALSGFFIARRVFPGGTASPCWRVISAVRDGSVLPSSMACSVVCGPR